MFRSSAVAVVVAASVTLQGCTGAGSAGLTNLFSRQEPVSAVYAYSAWSGPIKDGICSTDAAERVIKIAGKSGSTGSISCAVNAGTKVYRFPSGVFEIDEQMLVPESVAIIGASNPNDMSNPTASPDWKEQTVFLATRGATDFNMNYCHAKNMVTTRVGFVLSSHVTVINITYQGVDTIRPMDNGALCGGGAFETKGCAENDCSVSDVNNGGSDGMGSSHVTIQNVRLNDYFFEADKRLVGGAIEGNYDCKTEKWDEECCFCKPNGVRTSQVGVWVPSTRNPEGSHHIVVKNIVISSLQADGINFHGKVDDSYVENAYIQNTGDDTYALWGATLNPVNVTFKNCVARNPGALRPNWYGHCVATYGLQSVVFENIVCQAPTLEHPIDSPGDGTPKMDTTMFVFYNSFGAGYPSGNRITIKGWRFEDLSHNPYTAETGTLGTPMPKKMAWNKAVNGVIAPFWISGEQGTVNVYAYDTQPQEILS